MSIFKNKRDLKFSVIGLVQQDNSLVFLLLKMIEFARFNKSVDLVKVKMSNCFIFVLFQKILQILVQLIFEWTTSGYVVKTVVNKLETVLMEI